MDKSSGDKEEGNSTDANKRKPRRERKEDDVPDDKSDAKSLQDAAGKSRRKRGEDQVSGSGWLSQIQDNPDKPIPEPTVEAEDGKIIA
jgi:hypothetical protein